MNQPLFLVVEAELSDILYFSMISLVVMFCGINTFSRLISCVADSMRVSSVFLKGV
jgi:hypothetical protein